MGVVIDTNIIIEIVRGNKKVLDKLMSFNDIIYITSITWFEIIRGNPKEKELLLLKNIPVLPFDSKAAELSGIIDRELRDIGKSIDIRDLFIGSICIVNNLPLYTLNKKHFKKMEIWGLKLV